MIGNKVRFYTLVCAVAMAGAWLSPSHAQDRIVYKSGGNATLLVRAGPDAAAEIVGEIVSDTEVIEGIAQTGDPDWIRIVWGDGNGWVSTKFLKDADPRYFGTTKLPDGLVCGGTEPFWSARLIFGRVDIEAPDEVPTTYPLTGSQVADGHADFPVSLKFPTITAIVRPAACSDGMSDRSYPWTFDMIRKAPSGQVYVSGCCHLDAGVYAGQ